jgi:hypothetical protein
MQLTCPNCGHEVPASNVNIQQMAAVCPACNSLFKVELPEPKSKRRKIKQPEPLTFDENDHRLHMAFRTNFRLDRSEAFISSATVSLVFALITVISFASGASILFPLGFALLTAICFYWLALTVYNQTHIDMDDERIKISRQPLPMPFNSTRDVNLANVKAIRYEETPASVRESYDTPRYNVWAETVDGSRRIIVQDMVEEYAIFIAQRLSEYLDRDAEADVNIARLIDEAWDTDSLHTSPALTEPPQEDTLL